jgi:uncharacterized iron-regulated protein
MSSASVITVVKMLESLPEPVQDQVVAHLREYIADLRDELEWDAAFQNKQEQLVRAARRAKAEIKAGKAQALDPDEL